MVRAGDLVTAGLFGAAANFPWEMAHSLLYRGWREATWQQHLACCGLASLADGAGIAAIFGVGALVFRDGRWTRQCSAPRLGLAAALGLTGAVVTEQLALRLDWWAYGPAMPRVPGTRLGVSPLVQFLVLPLGVLFGVLPRWWGHRSQDT